MCSSQVVVKIWGLLPATAYEYGASKSEEAALVYKTPICLNSFKEETEAVKYYLPSLKIVRWCRFELSAVFTGANICGSYSNLLR